MAFTKEVILDKGRGLSSLDYDIISDYARKSGARNMLEIGCRYGTSTMLLGSIAKEMNGRLYCVEFDPQKEWFNNIDEAGIKDYVNLVRTRSPWVNYHDIPNELDFLFIDGDHRTAFAIADYHFFAPLVKVGGYIAIHDTNLDTENVKFMVNQAVDIILEDYKNVELHDEVFGEFGTKILRKTQDWGVFIKEE
jgi:predicted O-methyltransferase YrrM